MGVLNFSLIPHSARFSHGRFRNAKYNLSNNSAGSSISEFSYVKTSFQAVKSTNTSPLQETDSSKVVEKKKEHFAYTFEYIEEDIKRIRLLFSEVERGHGCISSYDTAWVAMVPSLENSQLPQFPQCILWIIDNQLSNGSWGSSHLPYIKDHLTHTLACIIALKRWNLGIKHVNMGLSFIRENIGAITYEDWYNPTGFDLIFTAMLEDARDLCLDLPYDSPPIKLMFNKREEILKSMAIDHMNEYKPSLVFVIEAFRNIVDWNKVLRHEKKDGSLFHSPSATACTLMHTRKSSCLMYLSSMLKKMENGVPSVHPINLITRILLVDKLERLGISRHFKCEIKKVLDNVYRCWRENDIIQELSSTSDVINSCVSFRILRWNGYDVSPDVFLKYLRDDDFSKFLKMSGQDVKTMLELYKTSQSMFPGERILEELKSFSQNYLAKNKEYVTMDIKHAIYKNLYKEVDHALSVPWVASVERIEHRRYIETYGFDDIQIGKTSYMIPCIDKDYFLTLAKKDYNMCQKVFQEDLKKLEKWYVDCKLGDLKFARQKITFAYFSAATTLFGPEKSIMRIIWTKNLLLTLVIDDFYDLGGSSKELKSFLEGVRRWDPTRVCNCSENVKILFSALYNTVNDITQDACSFQSWDIGTHLRKNWYMVVSSMMKEAEWAKISYKPSMEEYIKNGEISFGIAPMIFGSICFVGSEISEQTIHGHEYNRLLQLVSTCGRLLNDLQSDQRERDEGKVSIISLFLREYPDASVENATEWIRETVNESTLEMLKSLVEPSDLPRECKQLFWATLKLIQLFYLKTDGFTSPSEMLENINALLFDRVL